MNESGWSGGCARRASRHAEPSGKASERPFCPALPLALRTLGTAEGPAAEAPSLSQFPAAPAPQRAEKGQGAQPLSAGHPLLSRVPPAGSAETQPGLGCRHLSSPSRHSPVPKQSTGPNTSAFRISASLRKMATDSGAGTAPNQSPTASWSFCANELEVS